MFRRDATFAAAAFLPPFILYVCTRATVWALDTLYTIDSAEMVLAAATLGIDHPPGHPLYLLLARLFALLPFNRPDEGVILLSVFASALASAFVALAVRIRTDSDAAGFAAGWAFGFGLVVWFHASIAEVYAVQLASLAAFYALTAAWLRDGRTRTLHALFYVVGLTATTNVLLAVLLLPTLAYVVYGSGLLTRRKGRTILAAAAFCLLGLTPLLYLPIRLGGDGFISDFVYLNGYETGSLRWYLWYLSAEEFTASRITGTALAEYPSLLVEYVSAYVHNHSPFLAVLSAVGLFAVLRRLKRTDIPRRTPHPVLFERAVLIGWLATLLPVLSYRVADRDVFFMPSFLHLVLLGGFGLARLADAIGQAGFPVAIRPWLVRALSLIPPAFLAVSHFDTVASVTRDTSTYTEREARFRALPDGAIVVSTDDGRATRWKYWQGVRGLRPDVDVVTLGRLAPRYRQTGTLGEATGIAATVGPSLNLADRLRVLKGLREEHPDRPLYTVLDDRLPPELDHFRIRRAPFDPRLLRITDREPPVVSDRPPPFRIDAPEDGFREIDILGIDITGLDGGATRSFPEPVPIEGRVVDAVIGRSEFVEIGVVVRKRQPGHYFAEFAFVDEAMRIPGARGFTASRSLEIAPGDLPVGRYLRDTWTIKIPAFIPPGPHTLAVALNAVEEAPAGSYRGRTVRRMVAVDADRSWAGQRRYQPLVGIWLR